MAQLRDAQTSELLAEGTPLEVALLAQALGRDDLGRERVIFDGVGDAFDPAAVIASAQEQADGLEQAAEDADGADAPGLEEAAREAREELRVEDVVVDKVGEAIGRARGRAAEAAE